MKANNWKLGMSSCYKHSIEKDIFEEYAKSNIDMIEVSLRAEQYPHINWKQTEKYASEYDVEL